MKATGAFLLMLSLASTVAAVEAKSSGPRRVLYVGTKGTDRAERFETFLKRHFERVGVAAREGFDPRQAEGFDVVLLDWSQRDANPDGRFAFPYPERALKSPLGDRAGWSKPTVLLGSAGHLLAAAWQVHGGSG